MTIKLMEVCGTHTMAIARAGIKKLLPPHIRLISGPGCPVCVTAQQDIDRAVAVSELKGVIVATFGDMLRVPGTPSIIKNVEGAGGSLRSHPGTLSRMKNVEGAGGSLRSRPGTRRSLEQMRGLGADVRVVYSCMDSLEVARLNPDKKVVFVGVGFETTSPTVAATVLEARKNKIKNFYVLADFKRLFPALNAIACSKNLNIDGFICPGHVSVITGSRPYEEVARRSKKPCVITGFEPADIFKGIELLLKQIGQGTFKVEIAYERAVTKLGNKKALEILDKVFEPCDAQWRGIGLIPDSGLKFRAGFKDFDAKLHFPVRLPEPRKTRGCICADVIQGLSTPGECKLFKHVCSPRNPVGPCMVSSEGACAAAFKYGAD